MAEYDKTTSFRMKMELYHRLSAIVENAKMNQTETIRALLTHAIDEYEAGEIDAETLHEIEGVGQYADDRDRRQERYR